MIRTPLEAFRPSGEIHVRRPDKLPLLPHRRTTLPPKSGLKILYQTGVSLFLIAVLKVTRNFVEVIGFGTCCKLAPKMSFFRL